MRRPAPAPDFIPHIEEYGRPTGQPLVFFHGFPGSHRQGGILAPWTERFDLRVLSVDRPGYGHSLPQAHAGLKDFTLGLERALNQRGIDSFYLVGVSGGNPAAVCAAGHFGARVRAFGSVCGLAPFDGDRTHYSAFMRRGLQMVRYIPRSALKLAFDSLLGKISPEDRIRMMMSRLNAADREVLSDSSVREALAESIRLGWKNGSAGLVFDLKAYARPWPVNWAAIQCPSFIWHGEQDRILPVKMAYILSQRLPHARLKIYTEEGHYSLPIRRTSEILEDLVGGR